VKQVVPLQPQQYNTLAENPKFSHMLIIENELDKKQKIHIRQDKFHFWSQADIFENRRQAHHPSTHLPSELHS